MSGVSAFWRGARRGAGQGGIVGGFGGALWLAVWPGQATPFFQFVGILGGVVCGILGLLILRQEGAQP
jgi:hypothetical protein